MSICTDNPRLNLIGCGQSYSGNMAHSVARVPWSAFPDGRSHCTFVSAAEADRCWNREQMRDPATLKDREGRLIFQRDERAVWRSGQNRPVKPAPSSVGARQNRSKAPSATTRPASLFEAGNGVPA